MIPHLSEKGYMGARLKGFLSQEQNKTLLALRIVDAPQKVKDRAEVIRLNAHGWYVEKIATHFNWTPQTVREVLHKWLHLGREGLWELPGRGGKPSLKEEDIEFLAECLKKNHVHIAFLRKMRYHVTDTNREAQTEKIRSNEL